MHPSGAIHPSGLYDFSSYAYQIAFSSSAHLFTVILPFNFTCNKVSALPYPHWHTYYEILYAADSQSGKPYFLRVIPPKTPHKTFSEQPPENCICRTFCLYVSPLRPGEQQPDWQMNILERIATMTQSATIYDDLHAGDRFAAVLTELEHLREGSIEKISTELQLLLVDVARRLPPAPGEHLPVRVYTQAKLRELIIEHFLVEYAPFPASRKEELAELLHISPRQLSRILDESYGKSFRQLLLERRMLLAKGHADLDTPISRAAEACGYTSAAAFLNAYRRYWHAAYPITD